MIFVFENKTFLECFEFLKEHSEKNKLERIIIDYMAGQTDKYFLKECAENIKGFNMEELYRN